MTLITQILPFFICLSREKIEERREKGEGRRRSHGNRGRGSQRRDFRTLQRKLMNLEESNRIESTVVIPSYLSIEGHLMGHDCGPQIRSDGRFSFLGFGDWSGSRYGFQIWGPFLRVIRVWFWVGPHPHPHPHPHQPSK